MRVPQTEQEEQVDVAKDKITEDRPVVEVGSEVDLGAQEAILRARLVLPEQSPIHVDVPDEAIRRLYQVAAKVDPENGICLVLEPVV